MNLPLPNPAPPTPSTVLSRWFRTRKRLKSLRYWTPVTGAPKGSETSQPFLSVMLITYNHEQYIREALDSILMQVCEFSIEINVIDDASTDGTQKIAREYSERYPGIVNCYFNSANVGRVATQLNTIRGFQTLRGRYFSILEGDDYWTDPLKIAKQVAFLEKNTEFVACANNTLRVFEDNSRPPEHFLPFKGFNRDVATIYDVISMAGVYHLSSVIYRNVFLQNPPPCLCDRYSCEVTINMLYGIFGHFYCLDEYMSVYRVHGGGVFSGRTQENHWRFHLVGFRRFALYLGPRYWCMFARAVSGFSRYILLAPFRSREVTTLSVSSWFLFSLHFIVATFIRVFICSPMRFGASMVRRTRSALRSYSRRPVPNMLLKIARHPIIYALFLTLYLQRQVIRLLPDSIIHGILRAEKGYPRWLEARRALRDWILAKRDGEARMDRERGSPN